MWELATNECVKKIYFFNLIIYFFFNILLTANINEIMSNDFISRVKELVYRANFIVKSSLLNLIFKMIEKGGK
jgi:hypothetical protein